jgi:L,D-peptidoglycan transpeptidase YkuD (ErfK/YbiS/YcfS/YnhG family)
MSMTERSRLRLSFFLALLPPLLFAACAGIPPQAYDPNAAVPAGTSGLVVAVAKSPRGPRGMVRLFRRDALGAWRPDSELWPAALGERGVAWGIGLHPPQRGRQKREGDKRSPAGRFKIGTAYGNGPALPEGANGWPYVQKTGRDAWIDDPKLPGYNHFMRIPEGQPLPAWFEDQKMDLKARVLAWMVHIEHNYPDAAPGKGSAVFFHLWHGPKDSTSACVALPPEPLDRLLRWLEPARSPELVLLCAKDYRRLWRAWGLPEPSAMGL